MEHHIDFKFRARYYKVGEINASTRQLWFVLHGYGQLARFFLKKFEHLAGQGVVVVAPEGLSRFYLEDVAKRSAGGDNRVGATWMTREDRETDIGNYLAFLHAVYEMETSRLASDVQITIVGFSQGAATASRWIAAGHLRFERLILWAGIFPPDIDFKSGREELDGKKVIIVAGKQDPFITADREIEMEQLSQQLGVNPEKVYFDGKHELNDEVLSALASADSLP